MTDEFIELVKNSNDIVDVISEYTKLKRAGKSFAGTCPFPDHNDGTPSFRVYPDTQSFYCFGCGAGKTDQTKGSDIFAFIMKMKDLEFDEAVEYLADRANIPMEDKNSTTNRIYDKFINFSRDCYMELYQLEEVLTYLYNRGLTDKEINDWRIGFSSSDNYFKDRIIFPVLDAKCRTLGFTSRKFPDTLDIIKCKHSPTSETFKRNRILYGIHEAIKYIKETKIVYIVEGPFDCIAMHMMGIKNCVATLGCQISDEQIDIIIKLGAIPIIAYDGDKSGMKSNLEAAMKFIQKGVAPQIVIFPNELDPNDYMLSLENRDDAVENIKNFTVDYLFHMIESHIKVYDTKVLEAGREFYSKISKFINEIPGGVNRDSLISFLKQRIKGGL